MRNLLDRELCRSCFAGILVSLSQYQPCFAPAEHNLLSFCPSSSPITVSRTALSDPCGTLPCRTITLKVKDSVGLQQCPGNSCVLTIFIPSVTLVGTEHKTTAKCNQQQFMLGKFRSNKQNQVAFPVNSLIRTILVSAIFRKIPKQPPSMESLKEKVIEQPFSKVLSG